MFESESYGRVLVLDGVIQLTERDEASYQEMITHLPLLAHPNPKRVLIVGGGDGGSTRECCRHPGVEAVVQCEIDAGVVEVSRKFLGESTASVYRNGDPRWSLVVEDAATFTERHVAEFDVIIIDSSDPVGPAESLFTETFYKAMHKALRPGGILCAQGECLWLHLDLIADTAAMAQRAGFKCVDYSYCTVPSYPSGQIGFLMCGADDTVRTLRRQRAVPDELLSQMRYYTPALRAASFVLPAFAEKQVGPARVLAPDDAEDEARAAAASEGGSGALASVKSMSVAPLLLGAALGGAITLAAAMARS